jgi:hypothetical protein
MCALENARQKFIRFFEGHLPLIKNATKQESKTQRKHSSFIGLLIENARQCLIKLLGGHLPQSKNETRLKIEAFMKQFNLVHLHFRKCRAKVCSIFLKVIYLSLKIRLR